MPPPLDLLLQEAIAAARAGQVERARPLLLHAVHVDEENVQAWYWLSRVVERPHERQICLENVLALDPAHTAVQAELAALRRERAAPARSTAPRPAPEAGAEAALAAAVEPLDCPYCGATAAAAERRCPACERELWLRRPKARDHSLYSLGLVALWFGLANCLWLGLAASNFLADLAAAAEGAPQLGATVDAVGRLLGVESTTLPALDLSLTPVLLGGGLAFGLSLVIAWGLYRRLRAFYWLTVGLILAGFFYQVYAAAAAGTASLGRLAVLAAGLLLAMSFAFMAYDEFAWVEERLSAAVDRDVDSASSLYARGQAHARSGMWARAAAHWSRAVGLSPGHPDYRLALASAYINLDRPAQAREHLAEAQRLEPDHPLLAELQRQI